jgi:exo-beta-1,3-glucanase (GH17 family)
LIVGNEGLMTGRYSVDRLCAVMRELEQETGKLVSTTETLDWLLSDPAPANCSTFITANAHPLFNGDRQPGPAAQWTVDAWNVLRTRYPTKLLLLKEVGLPSAGASDLSPQGQASYYAALALTTVKFSYFEAFDATPRFKDSLIEQSWGLWRSDRTPKLVVSRLPWRAPAVRDPK